MFCVTIILYIFQAIDGKFTSQEVTFCINYTKEKPFPALATALGILFPVIVLFLAVAIYLLVSVYGFN